MSHRVRRTVLLASIGALAAGLTPGLHPTAADADQVSPVPSSRVFHVLGHGWGHGHGMSQDGADGAATVRHLSATQIVSFYYPHTSAGSIGNPTIRVLLSGLATSFVDVGKPTGTSAVLVMHDLTTNYQTNLPTSSPKWRFTAGVSSITMYWYDSTHSMWKPWQPAGHPSFPGPLTVSVRNPGAPAPMRVLRPDRSERDYHGYLRLVHAGTNNMDALSAQGMEDYLRGVVPRESPSSWPAAALQAQAIAARSYAEYNREHAGSRDYDICDTTQCQVFGGAVEITPSGTTDNLEAASSDAAVQATAGQIRTYGGKAIFAQFSASNGGWSTVGGPPYLVAQPDPYDGLAVTSNHNWSATLPASALESRYPSIGALLRIRVTQRDGNGQWGGRVLTAVLEGTRGSVTVSGNDVVSAYPSSSHSHGLKSSWWEILPAAVADFTGDHVTDLSVFRPSNQNWYVYGANPSQWGLAGDIPVPADYNGDGRNDFTVWRPSTGDWYVKGRSTTTNWGLPNDIPVPGDYNSNGTTDFAVWRPSTGEWYVKGATSTTTWGVPGDVPVPGDYNGDGTTDFAVWRPSTGQWWVPGMAPVQWGVKGDIPVPADYNGDGKTDLAVWRPSTGTWYVRGIFTTAYGVQGDVPVPGDYSGDGVTEIGVYRPSNTTWYRPGLSNVLMGAAGDEALPLPYAVYRTR